MDTLAAQEKKVYQVSQAKWVDKVSYCCKYLTIMTFEFFLFKVFPEHQELKETLATMEMLVPKVFQVKVVCIKDNY